jgi:hypothetical protein
MHDDPEFLSLIRDPELREVCSAVIEYARDINRQLDAIEGRLGKLEGIDTATTAGKLKAKLNSPGAAEIVRAALKK